LPLEPFYLSEPMASDLHRALKLHQAGRLHEAEAIYREILQGDPGQADALHLLGVLKAQDGHSQAAVGFIEQAIHLNPKVAEYHNSLGETRRALDQNEGAVVAYRQALVLKPDYVAAHYNLGNALQAQGDLEGAIAAYRHVLALSPDDATAHNNLGIALGAQHAFAEAVTHLERARALDSHSAEICFNLGNILTAYGKPSQAMAAYRDALSLKSDYPEACNALGTTLELGGNLSEAIAAYRRAIALKPDYAEAYNNLGNALHTERKQDLAIACYEHALALKPDYAEAYRNLGIALKDQGKFTEATAVLERALTITPDFPDAHSSLGDVLKAQGRIEAAEQAYRKALRLKPDSGAFHYHRLAMVKKYRAEDSGDIHKMLALLDTAGLAEEDTMYLHFALGKIFNDCGAYDDAFAHYRNANKIRHKESQFDRNVHVTLVERVMRTFDAEFFSQRTDYGCSSTLPVFVVGSLRSGTTLVEQIVASHRQVYGAGELQKIPELARESEIRANSSQSYPEVATILNRDICQSLAKEYETFLRRDVDEGISRITDKLPHNFMFLGFIALLFPKARVIHCVRNPLDTCLSIYFQLFQRGIDYAYDLADIGVYYQHYERLMAHWRRVLPIKVLEIRYEELVANQDYKTRELVDFLGLPWDQECLAFHRNPRPVHTLSAWQVRQPLYGGAIDHWRNYEKYLEPLKQSLGLDR
jgi:tetratricopeptide (TPR) repeat protein